MRGPRSHEGRTRRVDAVSPGEREDEPGKRWPAPAAWRAAGVRAQRAFDRACERGCEEGGGSGEIVRGAVGIPVEDEVRRGRIARPERALPPRSFQRRGRDEDAGLRPLGSRSQRERHLLDGREALVGGRWLELAQRAHLGGGASTPGSVRASRLSSSGAGREPKRSSSRSTRFT